MSVASRDRVLVFDFDGTVSLGNGPVRSYARFVADSLPSAAAADFLGDLDIALAGEWPLASDGDDSPDPIDGYDLVRLHSVRYGVDAAARGRAYNRSRQELATNAAPVIAPVGLAAFLAEARDSARLVLATNAPATRINEALDVLGLAGAFDAVHTAVGKPDGLGPILDGLLGALQHRPAGAATDADAAATLLSIGDVWENDLAPAHQRGASTALVGAATGRSATPTFWADALEELYPAFREWLRSPLSSAPSRPTLTHVKADR